MSVQGVPLLRRALHAALVLALLTALAACGGDGRVQEWRGLTLTLPEGWTVFERSPTLLSAADAPLGEDAGDPGPRTVAVQFTHDPNTDADDWRRFVEEEGGELETDTRITVSSVPATQLVFSYTTGGIPTREMVVTIPSRDIVALFQPVPAQGQTDAPEIFVQKRESFNQLLDSIRLGAPPGE